MNRLADFYRVLNQNVLTLCCSHAESHEKSGIPSPLVLAAASFAAAASKETALDRYVHAPDPSYKWELVNTIPGEGFNAYVLDLTSQTWKPPVEPDRTVWKHWLTVYVPSKVEHSTGFLYITGAS